MGMHLDRGPRTPNTPSRAPHSAEPLTPLEQKKEAS
jgi:hypothetical protein